MLYIFGTGPIKGFAITLSLGPHREHVHRAAGEPVHLRPLHLQAPHGHPEHLGGGKARNHAANLQEPQLSHHPAPPVYLMAASALMILISITSLIVKGGPELGIDFEGGYRFIVQFSGPVELGRVRRGRGQALGFSTHQGLQDFGRSDEVLILLPSRGRNGFGLRGDDVAEEARRGPARRLSRSSRSARRRSAPRSAASCGGRDWRPSCLLPARPARLHHLAFRVQGLGGRDRRPRPRRHHHLGLLQPAQQGDRPDGVGRLAHSGRLLDQRHHRRLRPHPGEHARPAPGPSLRGRRQHQHQPDAQPDDPHLGR